MEKLKMHTSDLTQDHTAKIREMFPSCVTEARDEATGTLRLVIDFDQLRQELSEHVVEGPQERYRLDWPGKRDALVTANAPIAKTLRPYREESAEFDVTKNILIEGDNLDALKILQETYLGCIKLIYIDPPYNTGRDFIYDDDFSDDLNDYLVNSNQANGVSGRLVANTEANGRFHSDWLSMMYARLRLARPLMKDDGVIFISIDDNEVDNLKKICNEVFGEENFVAQIIWQKVFSPKNTAQWFSEDHDYILVYAKQKAAWAPRRLPQTNEMIARYRNPDNDPRGPWTSGDLQARNYYTEGTYSITCPSGRVIEGPGRGSYWRVSPSNFKRLNGEGRIWWGEDGNNMPRLKRFLSEIKEGRTAQTIWFFKEVGHTQEAKKTLLKYVPFQHTANVLNSVKPVELLQRILQLAGQPGDSDIVLDFFSGSATTAHAVLKQNVEDGGNRRYIAIQAPEALPSPEAGMQSIFEMGLVRIRNVAAELQAEHPTQKLDVGFRVLKVDASNMQDVYYRPDELRQNDLLQAVDNIKPDRTAEDLLFQVLIDWGVDLTLPIERVTLQGKAVFIVDENALIACFEAGVTEELVREFAAREPLRVVFRDTGFVSDSVKINVEQVFRQLSPGTDVKSI